MTETLGTCQFTKDPHPQDTHDVHPDDDYFCGNWQPLGNGISTAPTGAILGTCDRGHVPPDHKYSGQHAFVDSECVNWKPVAPEPIQVEPSIWKWPPRTTCRFGDATCPCNDGDSCNHVDYPERAKLNERLADRKVEIDPQDIGIPHLREEIPLAPEPHECKPSCHNPCLLDDGKPDWRERNGASLAPPDRMEKFINRVIDEVEEAGIKDEHAEEEETNQSPASPPGKGQTAQSESGAESFSSSAKRSENSGKRLVAPSLRALELYYAQKDGCPNGHPSGCGKICLECVADELTSLRAERDQAERIVSKSRKEIIRKYVAYRRMAESSHCCFQRVEDAQDAIEKLESQVLELTASREELQKELKAANKEIKELNRPRGMSWEEATS